MKEELGNILSNRSASYAALGDHISALADADVVIQVKRPWSKGYFRKAKALVELGDLEGAVEEVQTALLFEPDNAVRLRVVYLLLRLSKYVLVGDAKVP